MFQLSALRRKPHPQPTGWALGTIALLHVLFALTFLVVLALAARDAQAATTDAEDPICRGVNLLDAIAAEAPETFEKIRRDAGKTLNGKGLLWRIEADGVDPSWLYGTMHLSDPRVLKMSDAARAAFDDAETVVLELEELPDVAKVQAGILANPALSMLDPGQSLQTLLSEEELQTVQGILDERGIPLALVSRMKPWLVFSMIVVPECEMERRLQGASAHDLQLAKDALAKGKRLEGLETIKEQLSAFAGLSLDLQVRMLADVAALGTSQQDRTETMIELYLDGEVGTIMPALLNLSETVGVAEDGAFNEFERDLILDRNHRMAERLQPLLADGNAFVGVGALHLPGEEGLIELLREQGFRVTAVQ